MDRGTLEIVKLAIAVAGLALLALEVWRARRPVRDADAALRLGWPILAVVAVLGYFRFSPEAVTSRYDAYDLVHYYLNAKYFDELGYTRLYQACVVADMEGPNRLAGIGSLRDLYDQQVKGAGFVREVREHPERVKDHFSKRRWRQFRRDLRVLNRSLKNRTWARILVDRGYNATPTWHAAGHALASVVPARHLKLLCHLDTVLIAAMFLVIGWCYGGRVAAIAIVWFCVSFSSSWPGVGWAMLRYDWLATVVAGVCLLSRGHRFTGGALVGWATLSRIFPGVVLLWLAVRAGHRLLVRRELDRDAVRIAAGFLLVVGLGTAVTWKVLGSQHFVAFRHDLEIQLAPENLSVNRMGLAVALAYRGETSAAELPLTARRQRYLATGRVGGLRTGLGVALLALLGLSIVGAGGRPARSEDDLGQLAFYAFALLLTASSYYWTMRLLAVLLHARHAAASTWDRRGLLALFGVEVLGWTFDLLFGYRYALTAVTSILVSLYAACVCVVRGRAALRRRREQRASARAAGSRA